jgi:PPK2 family polyphosphate:nucleotide phosphotransferase
MSKQATSTDNLRQLLRPARGLVDLKAIDANGHPGFEGDKAAGKAALAELADEFADLQERLYAESRTGGTRSFLLVVQGMDTSGKGGVMRHSVGLLDPQGVNIVAFKAPTAEERKHAFLWRIEKQVPEPGMIGIFDRSQYEDVLIGRVRALAPLDEIESRYDAINDFERRLVERGTTVVKVMLHISSEEQKARLQERLDNPEKHWKFNPGDVDERKRWDDYQQAYEIALERCNTDAAPFYVVPADRKWYRNWAVTTLMLEHLRDLDLQWPKADFDVAEQQRRLAAT